MLTIREIGTRQALNDTECLNIVIIKVIIIILQKLNLTESQNQLIETQKHQIESQKQQIETQSQKVAKYKKEETNKGLTISQQNIFYYYIFNELGVNFINSKKTDWSN